MLKLMKQLIRGLLVLLVGCLIGYALGWWQMRQCEQRLAAAQQRSEASFAELDQRTKHDESVRVATERRTQLLLAKEQLLRALVELHQNNYGLASQHLGATRKRLEVVAARMSKRAAARVSELMTRIAGAHTMTMRLDPMARLQIERLIQQIEQLPGAR